MSAELFANLAWSVPVVGALLTPLFSRINDRLRDAGAVAACTISVASATFLLRLLAEGSLPVVYRYEWVSLPAVGDVRFGILLDPLSVVMANVVAWISTLVFIYSLGYMRGDPGLTRYWFFMQLFVGNMQLLVLSENLIQMLVGWEGVGVCSYALIGYWYRDRKEDYLKCWVGEPPEAYPPSHCGMKAFITTRVGDVFMLVGMLLLAITLGTLSFTELPEAGLRNPSSLLLPSLLLLYVGAVGKSAQLPLMEWLPDAMAGPTSVSALIHSATMVKAGVYLTARLALISATWAERVNVAPFFEYVMWTGVLTALVSAAQAIVSVELKKTLAYSTVSQLGYMMAALGAASASPQLAVASAVFHLVNHAVFKASLFLCAGAVIHAVESRFYRHLGGLGKYMRLTMVAMLLASMSLAGVPPFSGFWSKDMILSAVLEASPLAFALLLFTASLTAFYTVRMLGLTFFGEESERVRERAEHHELHEAVLMLAPYLTLAVASLLLGLAASQLEHAIVHMIQIHGSENRRSENQMIPMISIAAITTGAVPAFLVYIRKTLTPPQGGFTEYLRKLLLRRLYINSLYYRIFVNSTIKLGYLVRIVDGVLDKTYSVYLVGLVMQLVSIVRGAELLADSALYRLSSAVANVAETVRRVHRGVLSYNIVLWLVGGLLIVLLAILLSAGW
jgi:NADH-quinone oxidoreductase subunit L